MTREEITNSQDYKATKAALKWWYSLPEEQRKATNIDAEPDIIDAYADGVIYGWSNPNWIPVEEELPKRMSEGSRFSDTVLVYDEDGYKDTTYYDYEEKTWRWTPRVTHWMEIQPPQGKEE